MQYKVGVLLVAGFALALASPVGKETGPSDDDTMIEPFNMDDDFDPPGFFSFSPFGGSFGSFFQSMENMMKRLRDQMTQVIHRLPPDNVDWQEIANGKGNTTSTTKVINGHKVTINETTYSNDGDNFGSLFKIRIVDVHPDSGEETKTQGVKDVEETTPSTQHSGLESFENTNEIPQGIKEIDSDSGDIETLDEELYALNEQLHSDKTEIDDLDTNEISQIVDLSNDIRVNQMMADAGAPFNPDAEIIDNEPESQEYKSPRKTNNLK